MKTCNRGHTRDDSVVRCQECRRLAARNYYARHKEKELKRGRDSYNKKKENRTYHSNPSPYSSPRSGRLFRNYGITIEEYEDRYDMISGRCEICNVPRPSSGVNGLVVDHNHSTGKFRGLLCSSCNKKLAGLDDIEWRTLADEYLSRNGDE